MLSTENEEGGRGVEVPPALPAFIELDLDEHLRLQIEKVPLSPNPTGKAGDRAARPKHSVARHDDRDRVLPDRSPDRARRIGRTQLSRQLAVGGRLAERNGFEQLPDRLLKFGSFHAEIQFEFAEITFEVGRQLPLDIEELRRVSLPLGRYRTPPIVIFHVEAG